MAAIDRRKVNEQSVSVADPIKSGYDLSYSSYSDYVLGIAHVGGVHYQMPGSKFSGHNAGNFTFNNISTPMVSPIDATQYNVAVSLRSIDRSFEDAFAPSKNNDMSINWRVPTWKLSEKVADFLESFPEEVKIYLFDLLKGTGAVDRALVDGLRGSLFNFRDNYAQGLQELFSQHYLVDALYDLRQYAEIRCQGLVGGMSRNEARFIVLDALLTPIFGEGSLIDELGYIKLRRYDLELLSKETFVNTAALATRIDDTPQNEYGLRAYYAAWYELMREPNLEPVASTLPNWKDFGSAAVCTLPFFCHRYRSWYDDPYTTAQVDDMSRHVYAPIFNTSLQGGSDVYDQSVSFPSASYDYLEAEDDVDSNANQHNLVTQTLVWRDPYLGDTRQVICPLPGLVRDSLRSASKYSTVYGLDLLNLRQAQSLERYLKRNFYFGDEYKDRMLAHYGSVVSDNRLNRPTLLSTSINAKEEKQEVANISTDKTTAGDRLATMTVKTSGDGYEYFSEEFCVVLNFISFMPRAQYAGVLPHNLLFRQMDFPLPEFAPNNEELSRVLEISASGLRKKDTDKQTFGHHPYGHIWRSRVDEVHGSFLSSRRDYTFARFFGSDTFENTPRLNYMFIHCRPSLGAFLNQIRLDGQLYGSIIHEFYSENPMPIPVENI